MNLSQLYFAPKYKELKSLGYYVKLPPKETSDSFLNVFTAIGSPYAKHCTQYVECTNNFIVPTQIAIAILAYGINNLPQFGNKLDNNLIQVIIVTRRQVMQRLVNKKLVDKDNYIPLNPKWNDKNTEAIYEALKYEAHKLADKVANRPHIPIKRNYDYSNGWYSKLIKK